MLKRRKTNASVDNTSNQCDNDAIVIAFNIGGGFGDDLIFANYLYCLKKKYNGIKLIFDVFFSLGYKLSSDIFEEGDLCRKIYEGTEKLQRSYYDCAIWFCRYPKVEWVSEDKIKRLSPELFNYLTRCQNNYQNNRYLFDNSPELDGYSAQYCILKGKTRIQQPDFDDTLGIKKDFDYPMFIRGNQFKFLEDNGIDGKFITIHRGNDTTYSGDAVKLWPLSSFNILVKELKKRYPGYLIVQIGVSRDRCPEIDNIDVDLVGKTNMNDVKCLLKYASLHIDSEGGFIHLRKILKGGPSVVFFGPTDMRFYGYDDNINIKGDGCDTPCEWVTKNWMTVCPRGYGKPPCMYSIEPIYVIDTIAKEWVDQREHNVG